MSDEYQPSAEDSGTVSEPTQPDTAEIPPTSQTTGVPKWAWWVGGGVALLLLIGVLLFIRTPAVAVPQVTGLSQADAEQALADAGLEIGSVNETETLDAAPGTIVEQSPAANDEAPEGSAVDVDVAVLPVVEVPDVVGKTLSQAEEDLAVEGLRAGAVAYSYSADVDAGKVIAQSPTPGTETTVAASVDLEVSTGPKQEQVPNVVGLSSSDGQAVLKASGFKAAELKAESKTVPAGDVISQAPAAGTTAAPGATVTITVSTGTPAAPVEPEEPPATSTDPTSPPLAEKPVDPPKPDGKPEEPAEPPSTLATVPDVVGMRVIEAVRALRDAQLKFDIAFGPSADNVLKIAEQDPVAGTEMERGSVVTLTIGLPEWLYELSSDDLPVQLPADPATQTPAPGSDETPSAGSLETTGQ